MYNKNIIFKIPAKEMKDTGVFLLSCLQFPGGSDFYMGLGPLKGVPDNHCHVEIGQLKNI